MARTRAALLAGTALVASTAAAQAQSTWIGTTSDYNTPTNWSNTDVPDAAGKSAIFSSTGIATVNVSAVVAPDGWTFKSDAQSYTITGTTVTLSTGLINNSTVTQSIANIIDGAANVQQNGTGTLTLSGANTYSGGTIISAGTLQVTHGTSGGSSSVGTGAVTLDGGTFQGSGAGNLSFNNAFNINGTGGTLDNNGQRLTLSGTISDGTFGAGGPGQLVIIDSTGTFNGTTVLSGNNNYTGGTLVSNTALQVRNSNAVGTGTVTLNDALFQLGGSSNLTFSNNFKISDTIFGSAIDNNNRTLTINGNITDGSTPGSLTFENFGANGRTILNGTNTYTGGTTICACGTVQLGDATHTGSLVGQITNEGLFSIVNANTAGITAITNDGGVTRLFGTNSASSATIINMNGGRTSFFEQSTAGSATITNRFGSGIEFFGTSTAGNANITNRFNGTTNFFLNSSAGDATITNRFGGLTNFGAPGGNNAPNAGNAMIFNNNGGETNFNAFSTAGNATITTKAGGTTYFYDNSTGGNAQFITSGTGFVDFSGTLGPNGDGQISAGSIAGSGSYYIGGGNTLTVGGNALSTEVSGVIADNNPCGCTTGPGALVKTGAGTLTLSGINTYSGGTTFAGGAVSVSQEANLGDLSGTLTFNGGILQITGTTFSSTPRTIVWGTGGGGFDIADAGNTFTVGQNLTVGGPLSKLGAGTLVLTGTNTYSGGTTIAGGTLSVGADNNIGSGVVAMLDGTTLKFTSGFTFTHPITVAGDPTFDVTAGVTTTIAATISDGATPGDVIKTDAGTLVFAAANIYTGATTVNAGKLQAGAAGAFPSASAFTVASGATLDLNSIDQTIASLAGSGFVTLGAATLTTGGNNSSSTFSGVISGSGGLTKTGTGTFTLTGTNLYTGGTTVTAGTLDLTNGNAIGTGLLALGQGTTLQLDGSFTLANKITVAGDPIFDVTSGNTATVSGVISDATAPAPLGVVEKTGAGTLVLSGVNTYSGGTVISAGTLQVTNGSSVGSGKVTLDGGVFQAGANNLSIGNGFAINTTGGAIDTIGNTLTLSGVVADGNGAGALVKTGLGTLVLTANNTYTGGTTIAAGALQLGSGGASGSIVGDVVDNGVFAINRSDSFTFGAVISGTGAFQQNGSGTTILTAANTYTGGTTITAGTLQLGNGGASGSIVGNVVDNGAFAINRSDSFTFGAVISGTGAFQQNGSGTTIFTAAQTYTGGTTITAGTLQLGNGGASGSIVGNVVNNATFAINRSDSVTFGGVISGTGAFQQNGSGTTILTAANTYTGGTTIAAGTLQLGNGGASGSIVGNVVNNATLAVSRSDSFSLGGVISGTGAFQQNGSGTTILTAANTYTGGTTIAAGTLQLGNGGASGSIVGNVVDNGVFAINRSDSFTFGTVISGTGAFQQNGSGTTILTAANTYTGGTTIAAGTLQLGNGGTSGSIAGNVVDNGVFAINRSDSFTFGTVISGTGAFQQNGSGTTILTAANTYTGGTTIAAGTVQLGNGGTSGSIAGNVVDNGVFAINRSDSFTFGTVISGTGAFQQNGSGTTILTAANTYTGGTTIAAGTLQLGNGGASGSIVGDVVNNATFAVNRSDSITFGGVISGTGAFQQNGNGTTILTAANTYTGGTTIAAGTLQLGNGGTSGSIGGNVVDNGVFAINRSDIVTFGGVISGTGAFQQNGAGVTVLTGASTLTGPATVNAGALIVNGSLPSAVTVNAGALLGGTGTVGPVRVNGGTLSPGNSIGTITVAGSLVFTAAAAYVVEVSPTAADRTNVSGAATLAGALALVPQAGAYSIGTRYVVLNAAGGVSGTFATGDLTGMFGRAINAHVVYDPNNVILSLDPNTISQFLPAATAVNPRNVAAALDAGFLAGNAPAQFLSLFNLPNASLPGAFTSLSGEAATGASRAGFRIGDDFLQLMLDPFAGNRGEQSYGAGPALSFAPQETSGNAAGASEAGLAFAADSRRMVTKAPALPAAVDTFDRRWTVWGASFGGSGKFNGDPSVIGSHDVTARDFGFAAGADYRVAPGTVIGAALAGGSLSYGLANGLGGGNGDSFLAGLYGSTRAGNAYVSMAVDYGIHDLRGNRTVVLPGVLDGLSSNFHAQQFGLRAETGYRFDVWSRVGATPYAALQAQWFHVPGYNEIDASGVPIFALGYASSTVADSRSEFGLRGDYVLGAARDWALALRGRVAWAHDFNGAPSSISRFLALPATSFEVSGAGIARDAALTTAGFEYKLANGFSFLGKFDGTFASTAKVYAGSGTLRMNW